MSLALSTLSFFIMAVCAAAHCHNTTKKGFVMMRFPKNSDLLESWTTCLGRPGWKPSVNSRICHDHFEANAWTTYPTQLKADASPSRFCTCGFAPKLSASKVRLHQEPRLDHCYTKPLTPTTKENILKPLHDHSYSKPKLAPTTEDLKESRKIPCALNCPCTTAHLESCVMSHIFKVGTSLKERKVLLTKNPSAIAKLPKKQTSSQNSVSNKKCCPEQMPESNQVVLDLLEQNKSLREEIELMKAKINSASTDGREKQSCTKENKSGHLNDDQKAAVEWGTTRGREWSNATIKKGLQLRHACNTNGYNQVIKSVAPFPSVRTLQRRTQHLKFEPGILEEILDAFEVELKNYNDQDKDCGLYFDEMSISQRVEIDRSTGLYIGNPTLPGVTEGVACKALVFMFGGIHKKWKLTVAYHFVPKDGYPESVAQVIRELLIRARIMGLHVRLLVCDMGNRAVLRALGFCTTKDNIIFKIPHPADPQECLYFLPDMVHVFKSTKEMLSNNRFLYLPASVVDRFNLPSNAVCIGHIEWLHDYQEEMELKMAPKLKISSIHTTHFNKMKVGSATDVLNDKTSAGLSFLVHEKIAPAEYQTTSFFCNIMSNWFNYVTARTRALALSVHNQAAYEEAISTIRLVLEIFEGMEVPGGWKPCQTHIIITCRVVLALHEELLLSGRYEFIMLGRLLNDIVENLFSVLRLQRPNPTPLQFKFRLKQVTLSQFMEKISTSSYGFDDRVDGVDLLLSQPQPKPVNVSVPDGMIKWSMPDLTCKSKDVVEENVLYRVCGYVLSRLVNRQSLKCSGCISALQHGGATHKRGLFTQMTNFKAGAQFEVSDEVFQMCKLINHNLKNWKPILTSTLKVPMSYVTTNIVMPCLENYVLSTCHDVKRKFVSAFIEMRLKQFSGKKAPASAVCGTALSSKSTGSRLLADRYKPKNAKKSVSYQRLIRNP